MRFCTLAFVALTAALAACGERLPEEDASTGAQREADGFDAYDYDTWPWKSGSRSCSLSPVGQNIERAVRGARHNTDIMPDGRDDRRWVTTRNVAGPALRDSNEMFPALRVLVARAKHEVDIQWHVADPESDGFDEVIKGIKALNAKLESGETDGPVVIRFVTPAWVFRSTSPETYAAKIREQVPHLSEKLTIKIAGNRYFGIACMHVKMMIVDGVIVHAGGGNLSKMQNFKRLRATGKMVDDATFRELHEKTKATLKPGVPVSEEQAKQLPLRRPEHDSAYVVKGEVAQAALAQFDDLWNARSTSVSDCTATWSGASKCAPVEDKLSSEVPGGHVDAVLHPDLEAYGVGKDACVPMVFMAKKATENVFNFGGNNPIAKGFYAAFNAAQTSIKVSSPNVNDKSALVLRSAVKRFKKAGRGTVQVLEPIDFNWFLEAVPVIGGGENIAWMLALNLTAGKEHQGPGRALDFRWHSLDGKTAHKGWGKEIGRHIKYYSIDGRVAIIGSTNLDKQSMHRSREIAIAVDDPEVTKLWDSKIYDPDFSVGAKTYEIRDAVEDGKNPEPVDTTEATIESIDESESNEESGAAKDGPPSAAAEESLMRD